MKIIQEGRIYKILNKYKTIGDGPYGISYEDAIKLIDELYYEFVDIFRVCKNRTILEPNISNEEIVEFTAEIQNEDGTSTLIDVSEYKNNADIILGDLATIKTIVYKNGVELSGDTLRERIESL